MKKYQYYYSKLYFVIFSFWDILSSFLFFLSSSANKFKCLESVIIKTGDNFTQFNSFILKSRVIPPCFWAQIKPALVLSELKADENRLINSLQFSEFPKSNDISSKFLTQNRGFFIISNTRKRVGFSLFFSKRYLNEAFQEILPKSYSPSIFYSPICNS